MRVTRITEERSNDNDFDNDSQLNEESKATNNKDAGETANVSPKKFGAGGFGFPA